MVWKCKVMDRYIQYVDDDGRIAGTRERGEAFGDKYTALAELYHKKARLAVVERDGPGTLIEAETGRIVAHDRPGRWTELRPHIGHELYMGDQLLRGADLRRVCKVRQLYLRLRMV